MSFTPNPQNEILGLENIRNGSLYLIVAALLFIVGDFLAPTIFGAVIVYIIALIFIFLAYSKLRDGFGILQSTGKNTGLGKTGATLLLVGMILNIIGAILLLVFVGIAFLVLGSIVVIIGEIFVGIGLYNTGNAYNEGLLETGGILVAIIITAFIGYILAYVSLGNIINRLKSGSMATSTFPTYGQSTMQQPMTSQPGNIYQIGTGNLNAYGEAHIVIYTPSPIQIISAEIVGTSMISSSITPNLLSSGSNNVTINFGTITGLLPNNTYTIQLTLGNGQTIDTIVSYKP